VLELLAQRLGGTVNRNAADGDRTRAAGAGAALDAVGVALHHAHALRGGAEPLRDQLRVRRRMPLPGRLRADEQRHAAVAVERQRCRLGPVVAAGLDISRNADAAQAPGAPRLRRALVEAVPVGKLLRA